MMLSSCRINLRALLTRQTLTQWATLKPISSLVKSKLPQVDEKDLAEHFSSGSGPGGQCVNKSVNCCNLKHIPTGIVIKVHHTRSLEQNRQIARELLAMKLDDLYNGENSVRNQKKKLALERESIRDVERERRRALKAEFKKFIS